MCLTIDVPPAFISLQLLCAPPSRRDVNACYVHAHVNHNHIRRFSDLSPHTPVIRCIVADLSCAFRSDEKLRHLSPGLVESPLFIFIEQVQRFLFHYLSHDLSCSFY
jgi:hypothetical protein